MLSPGADGSSGAQLICDWLHAGVDALHAGLLIGTAAVAKFHKRKPGKAGIYFAGLAQLNFSCEAEQAMKCFFLISLMLNFLTVGSLVFWKEVCLRTQNQVVHPSNWEAERQKTKAARNDTKAAATDSWPKQTFRWSRLESQNDYRMYVANLRAIGCPEATIRDIVCGDTARAFAGKRRELGLSGDGNGPWSFQRQKSLEAELLGESGQTNYLVGKTTTTDQPDENEIAASYHSTQSASGVVASPFAVTVSSGSPSLASRLLASKPVAPPVYPLVMQNVNWDALGLTSAQKAAVQELQQQFIAAIGGLNQSPNDPVYLRRWQQAQPQNDFLLKAMLGVTAWENYQLLAADSATPPPDPYAALNSQP